jgi:hypothetical protein
MRRGDLLSRTDLAPVNGHSFEPLQNNSSLEPVPDLPEPPMLWGTVDRKNIVHRWFRSAVEVIINPPIRHPDHVDNPISAMEKAGLRLRTPKIPSTTLPTHAGKPRLISLPSFPKSWPNSSWTRQTCSIFFLASVIRSSFRVYVSSGIDMGHQLIGRYNHYLSHAIKNIQQVSASVVILIH